MNAAPAPSSARSTDAHALLHTGFRWQVPERFNIAQVCCGRWARQPRTARRVAVAWEHEDGRAGTLSYGELQAQADRLSHALQRLGV
ncbi:MAG TPA: AMP-binding protein, partial [Rubrivivax sp.]|nr:AMP-binding protein [Rubrivivax sp.]